MISSIQQVLKEVVDWSAHDPSLLEIQSLLVLAFE